MSTLAENQRINLLRSLRYFEDFEEQRCYKRKVPIVHIPNELRAQWDAGFRRVKDRDWFKLAYSSYERKMMEAFDAVVQEFDRGGNEGDVPEIFLDDRWMALRTPAKELARIIAV